jgi:enoyl-CoA hydratase/carnithine racemase
MFVRVLAGADIKEMKDRQFIENYVEDFLGHWTQITKIRKPIIAAVNGFAVCCHFSRSCLIGAIVVLCQ